MAKNNGEISPQNLPTAIQAALPKNVKILKVAKGDLNADGKADYAVVTQHTDPTQITKNEGYPDTLLDENPRHLWVFLHQANTFQLLLKTADNVIPIAHSFCQEEPLSGVKIERGFLWLSTHFWTSCGSWETSDETYQFRLTQTTMRLIGLESSELHRASGDTTSYSLNFLTQKAQIGTGNIGRDEAEKIDRVKFRKHPKDLATMETLPLASEFFSK